MRVCLLTNQDLSRPLPPGEWPCDPRPFLPEAQWTVALLVGKRCEAEVERRLAEGYDLYFNLCDGAADQDKPGIEVVQALERAGVAFTGATSAFYEPSRLQMKEACRRAGVDTPAFAIVESLEGLEEATAHLRYPLFVKHHTSYASVSLSRQSKVATPAGLRRQVAKILARHGAALVEEYIDGTEATVLVAENPDDPLAPTTYTPIAYRFPPGEAFKHEKLKWKEYDTMSSFPVTNPELAHGLREASARFFVAIGGASYGRCDIRVDALGRPYILEINPNCGIYYPPSDPGSADLILAHDPAGHEGFTRQIVRAALGGRG